MRSHLFKNAATPLRTDWFCGGKVGKRLFNKATRAAMRGAAYREMREAAIEIQRPSRRREFSKWADSAIKKITQNCKQKHKHQPLPSQDIVIEVEAEFAIQQETRTVPVFYRIKGCLYPAHAVYC